MMLMMTTTNPHSLTKTCVKSDLTKDLFFSRCALFTSSYNKTKIKQRCRIFFSSSSSNFPCIYIGGARSHMCVCKHVKYDVCCIFFICFQQNSLIWTKQFFLKLFLPYAVFISLILLSAWTEKKFPKLKRKKNSNEYTAAAKKKKSS